MWTKEFGFLLIQRFDRYQLSVVPADLLTVQLGPYLKAETLMKIEERGLSVDDIRETDPDELGHMLRLPRIGSKVA